MKAQVNAISLSGDESIIMTGNWFKDKFTSAAKDMDKKLLQAAHKLVDKSEVSEKELNDLLNAVDSAEVWVGLCFALESRSDHKRLENLWLAGLEKFQKSVLYQESLGYFYYRHKKYHKALHFLQKAMITSESLLPLKVSISAAFALAQYQLVWDYFQTLPNNERKNLEDDLIAKVATAALEYGKYKEAQNLFVYLKEKNNLPSLPTLKESLINQFGSDDQMTDWFNDMKKYVKDKKARQKHHFSDWVTYALVLLNQEKYKDALNLLETVREEQVA